MLAAALCLACSRAETRAAPAPADRGLTLASPTAFALRATASGALLGWISGAPSVLSLARFDAGAELVGPVVSSPIDVAPSLRDLSLVESEATTWLVWSEAEPPGAKARAAAVAGAQPPQVFDLGAAWSGSASEARGNLALGELAGGALALGRGASVPCADAPLEQCFAFHFYELSAAGVRETGVPLSVPVPCSAQAAQLVTARPRSLRGVDSDAFEYAICTRAGDGPVLTVFSIERDRKYAAAQRVLPGCAPLGAGRFAGQSSFVAECGADRRMARLVDPDRPPRVDDISIRGLVCEAGQARIRLGDEWLGLAAPVDHLELLVGDDLAPRGASAVWTGRTLLVATAESDGLAVVRYACHGSRLERIERPALRS